MSRIEDRPPPPPPPPPQPAATPRSRPSVPPPARRFGRRGALPVATAPDGVPSRRRWGRFAAGTLLALLGAWTFAILYVSAGDRVEVLALAHNVDQYTELTEGDFRTVRISTEPGMNTVKATDRDEVIGRKAAVPLLEGSLLSESALLPEGQQIGDSSKALIGIRLGAGTYPELEFYNGLEASITIRSANPAQGDDATIVDGCIITKVGDVDANSGQRTFSLLVPASDRDKIGNADSNDLQLQIAIGDG